MASGLTLQQKSEWSEQLCRVGVPGNTFAFPSGDPQVLSSGIAPLADDFGRLIVVADGGPLTATPLFFSTEGTLVDEQSLFLQSAHRLIQLAGFNNDSVTRYVQVYDQAGGGGIDNSVPPKVIIPVPSGGTFSYGLSFLCNDTMHIGLSTVPTSFTSAGPNMHFTLLYLNSTI